MSAILKGTIKTTVKDKEGVTYDLELPLSLLVNTKYITGSNTGTALWDSVLDRCIDNNIDVMDVTMEGVLIVTEAATKQSHDTAKFTQVDPGEIAGAIKRKNGSNLKFF